MEGGAGLLRLWMLFECRRGGRFDKHDKVGVATIAKVVPCEVDERFIPNDQFKVKNRNVLVSSTTTSTEDSEKVLWFSHRSVFSRRRANSCRRGLQMRVRQKVFRSNETRTFCLPTLSLRPR